MLLFSNSHCYLFVNFVNILNNNVKLKTKVFSIVSVQIIDIILYALYLPGLGRGHAKRRFVVLERPIKYEIHRISLCVLSVEANQLISRKRSPQAPMMR